MSIGDLSRRVSGASHAKLPGLHGLRALAACAIVLLHTIRVPQPWLAVPHALAPTITHLRNGVALFFILSAFSLLYSNVGIVERRGWVAIYLIKRLFRIAPLFYAMLVFYLVLSFYHRYQYDLTEIIANFLFAFNFVPDSYQSIVWAGWTIGVEMPFYLCVPLILIGVRNLRHAWLLVVATAIVSIVSRIAFRDSAGFPTGLASMALSSNLVVFALGVLAFHMAQRRTQGWLPPLLALFAIGGLLLMAFNVVSVSSANEALDALVFAPPLTALCLWQVLSPSRWLASPQLQWMGERSYSIYLLHPFIVQQFAARGAYTAIAAWTGPWLGDWAFLLSFALTLAAVTVAAALAYQLIERPGQRLGTELIHRLFGRAGDVTPLLAPVPRNP
jgi:peptidoglycan/LPS O-acetylase OafA/YrhL